MAIQPLPRVTFPDGEPSDYLRPAADDNYLAHLAPFSIGAIFFGNFCPR